MLFVIPIYRTYNCTMLAATPLEASEGTWGKGRGGKTDAQRIVSLKRKRKNIRVKH